MSNDVPRAADRGSECNDLLGLAPERDEVLRQLDDRTNQTWAWKRKRWAALVRAQDAQIQRLKNALWKACGDDGETAQAYIDSQI